VTYNGKSSQHWDHNQLSRSTFRSRALQHPKGGRYRFEVALVLVRFDHVAPELNGSLRRGRLTSSPPQFGQTKYICSAQLAQYVHS
jgi:hypothetical protein